MVTPLQTSSIPVTKGLLLLAMLALGTAESAVGQQRDLILRRELPQAVLEPRQDILILRSGRYQQSPLMGCSAGSCSLGGQSYRRDEIMAIGLGVASSDPPPTIDDPSQDTIQLRNATVFKTKLLGINAQAVVSQRGSNPRREVAWVYLAPPQPGSSDPIVVPSPPPPSGSAASTPPPPPPPPPVTETRQPPPPAPTPGPRRPNYVWYGWIEVDNSFEGVTLAVDVHGRHKWTGVHRLKFLEKWTDRPSAVSDASGRSFKLQEVVPLEMNYTIQADHHHDYDYRWGDTILRGTAAGNITGGLLRRVFRGEILRFESLTSPRVPYAQRRSFGSWREFQDFVGGLETSRRPGCFHLSVGFIVGQPVAERRALYRGISRSGASPIHPDPDQDFLRVMPSHMPDGTGVYSCLEEPEQRNVRGEYTYPFPDAGPLNNPNKIAIKWAFTRCREGAACPMPPYPERVVSPDPPPKPCPEPTLETSFLNLAIDQLKLLSDQLAKKSDELLKLQNQARQYKSDFELAIYTCDRISDLQVLIGLLMGQGPENVQEFTNALGMIQKILDGDPSFVFSNETYFAKRRILEQKWDTLMYGAGKLSPDRSSPRDRLMSCAGSNLDTVFEDAMTFVQLTEQIAPLLPQASKILNDMRAKDNQIKVLWDKYSIACLRYAQCKKLPASYCQRLPSLP